MAVLARIWRRTPVHHQLFVLVGNRSAMLATVIHTAVYHQLLVFSVAVDNINYELYQVYE